MSEEISGAAVEEINDAIEGAVIEKLVAGVEGLHIMLRDGRMVLFPDAQLCAVIARPRFFH